MDKLASIFCIAIVSLCLSACQKSMPSAEVEGQPVAAQNVTTDNENISQETTPISTPHYSLTLPKDWVVLYGPVKERGTTRFQLADKAKSSTVSITVGPSQPGDAEAMARRIATRLQTNAVNQNGQWQCHFTHENISGYTIIREDPANALLMVLTASGDINKADFVFQMRSPYTTLLPKKP